MKGGLSVITKQIFLASVLQSSSHVSSMAIVNASAFSTFCCRIISGTIKLNPSVVER